MSPTKACSALQNEPLVWMLCPHGDGLALGWRGSRECRERAYTLFLNYHAPVKHGASPALCEVNEDISYIYMSTLETLTSTLNLFFHVNAVRDGDVEVKQGWSGEDTNENPLEYEYGYDEIEADKLAGEATQAFLTTIKPTHFIPSLPKPHGDTYSFGQYTKEELTPIEDYASAASS